MTEIKFEDYLSEGEQRQIVADVFREQCLQKFTQDSERIFSNAAYSIVTKLVDEQMNGKMVELITENTIKIINSLREYTVFKRPDAWDKGSSEAYKLLQKVVVESEPLLKEKIQAIINNLEETEIRQHTFECISDLLDRKLFGVKND